MVVNIPIDRNLRAILNRGPRGTALGKDNRFDSGFARDRRFLDGKQCASSSVVWTGIETNPMRTIEESKPMANRHIIAVNFLSCEDV